MNQPGKTIGIYSYGRKQSKRCPNKILRPFGNTTLLDILLVKIKEIGGENAFFSGYEDEFKEKCEAYGVKFVRRSENSALVDEPITECQEFLKRVDFDYVLCVNACIPFLKVETIRKFIENAKENGYKPAMAVIRRHNYFYFNDGTPANFSASIKTLNTKAVTPMIEMAQALFFFNRKYFFEHGRYWDWQSVRLIELPDKSELLDVDTEDDFMIVENIWKAKNMANARS